MSVASFLNHPLVFINQTSLPTQKLTPVISIFVQPSCFLVTGSFFIKASVLQCFVYILCFFVFCSLSLICSISSPFLHCKPPILTSSPKISNCTHNHLSFTQTTPTVLPQNWPISSFSTSPGHHMYQSQFYQHLGKLGSTSTGVSEWHHYGILHPVLQY